MIRLYRLFWWRSSSINKSLVRFCFFIFFGCLFCRGYGVSQRSQTRSWPYACLAEDLHLCDHQGHTRGLPVDGGLEARRLGGAIAMCRCRHQLDRQVANTRIKNYVFMVLKNLPHVENKKRLKIQESHAELFNIVRAVVGKAMCLRWGSDAKHMYQVVFCRNNRRDAGLLFPVPLLTEVSATHVF